MGALDTTAYGAFVVNPVPILVNNAEGAEHIESIVNAPLHVLEVHLHIPVPVNLQDPLGYLSAGRFSVEHHLLQNLFGEEH